MNTTHLSTGRKGKYFEEQVEAFPNSNGVLHRRFPALQSFQRQPLPKPARALFTRSTSGFHPGSTNRNMVHILKTLNNTGTKRLPSKFVTKSRPWPQAGSRQEPVVCCGPEGEEHRRSRSRQSGRQIAGETLARGGPGLPRSRRGSKRLVFSDDGTRMVTVDHYQTFTGAGMSLGKRHCTLNGQSIHSLDDFYDEISRQAFPCPHTLDAISTLWTSFQRTSRAPSRSSGGTPGRPNRPWEDFEKV